MKKKKIYNLESMERFFKGVWIPKEIWLASDLSNTEKFLLAEIDSLDNGEGCYASNEYLSEFIEKSIQRTVSILTELRKKGYLEDKKFDGRKRWISIKMKPLITNNYNFDKQGGRLLESKESDSLNLRSPDISNINIKLLNMSNKLSVHSSSKTSKNNSLLLNQEELKSQLWNYLKETNRKITENDIKYLKTIKFTSESQTLVEYYKIICGYNNDDSRAWNNVNFTRFQKTAVQLTKLFRTLVEAFRAIDIISIWAEKNNLQWTLETVAKKWFDFKTEKLKINNIQIPLDVIIYQNEFCEKGYPVEFDEVGHTKKYGVAPIRFE